jgi:peptide/nickel transport system substrate-binding protein
MTLSRRTAAPDIAILVAILLCLTACGSSGSGSGGQTQNTPPPVTVPTPDVQQNYNITAQPSEPAKTDDAADAVDKYGGVVRLIDLRDFNENFGVVWRSLGGARHFSSCFTEGLVDFTQAGVYEPHLAESWKIDYDAKTITFKLREDVRFHDGSPFNAEALIWNMNTWFDDSRGNEELRQGTFKALDEFTVEIPFVNWQNVLFETFASHSYSPISMESALKNGMEYAEQNPVGTGPFKLKTWNKGTSVIFERNDDYWMEGKPYLDGVEYYNLTDVLVQNAALISTDAAERIDFYACTNAEQAWTLMNQNIDHDWSYLRGSGTFALCPDSVTEENNPFFDIRVRTAVSLALDRESLCEAKGFGIWKPALQLVSPNFSGHLEADNPYLAQADYDPAKAKALLAEAGYPDGFKTPLFSSAQYTDQMVAISDMLKQIGIVAELDFPEPAKVNDLAYHGWEGLLGFNWGQVMNTGISFYGWYNPEIVNFLNVNAFRPPEYKDMYYAARRSFDLDQKLFGDINELTLRLQVFVPVYHNNSVYFIRNGLKDAGFKESSASTMWTPWNAYWEK